MSSVKSKELTAKSTGKKDKVVVEKGDADELPPGWKKEVKFRTGYASTIKFDKFYTDPVTGYIFHSLKDVQRYLKTGVVGKLASKPKDNYRVDVVNEDGKSNVVVEKGDTDELPPGWKKEVKFRTGSATKFDKDVVKKGDAGELPRGWKKEVKFRTGFASAKKIDKVVVEKGDAGELPPGWKKEVKFRTGYASTTKFDKFYTDPVTGYIFRSLKDVQRYLKTGVVGKLARKPKDNWCVDVVNEDGKSNMKEKEEMSETWRNKRPREDTSEAYQIRSKLVENGKSDSHHRASKRLAGIENNSPTPPSPSTEPKTRLATRLTTLKTDTPSPPKTRRTTLAGIKIDSPPPSSPDTRSSRQATRKALVKIASASSSPEPKTQQPTEQSGIKIDELATSAPEQKTRHTKRNLGTEINASPASLSEPKTCQAKQLTEMEIDASQPVLLQEIKPPHQATRSAGIGDNASPLSLPERLTRKSTRLAGSKINSPPPSRPDTRASRKATARRVNLATSKKNEAERNTKKHDENTDMDDKPNHNQESSVISHPIVQETHKKQESHTVLPPATSQEQYKVVETGHTVVPVPPVNLEKQKAIVVSPPVSNPIPQNAESSMNISLNDLWTDPCIEFAVKTLTGAIPFNDLIKADNFTASPLQVPMHDIWTDPCIEFAVKTLTGAIPVADSDYLQFRHQPVPPASSSNPQALHDFNLPDVGMNCQTDVYLKHYETTHTKQQESVVQTVGNGGLQKSGNVVNGQCSRSRFFQ